MDLQYAENCKVVLPDDCWKECSCCQRLFLEKYWDEELDWYIELNLSNKCTTCYEDAERERVMKTPTEEVV